MLVCGRLLLVPDAQSDSHRVALKIFFSAKKRELVTSPGIRHLVKLVHNTEDLYKLYSGIRYINAFLSQKENTFAANFPFITEAPMKFEAHGGTLPTSGL